MVYWATWRSTAPPPLLHDKNDKDVSWREMSFVRSTPGGGRLQTGLVSSPHHHHPVYFISVGMSIYEAPARMAVCSVHISQVRHAFCVGSSWPADIVYLWTEIAPVCAVDTACLVFRGGFLSFSFFHPPFFLNRLTFGEGFLNSTVY